MANTQSKTTKSSKSTTATAKKTATRGSVAPVVASDIESATSGRPVYHVRRDLDPRTVVPVRNGFQGILTYVSKRTGETFRWDSFGDEQDMELGELRNAKSASKDFFSNNWFLIDDPEVLDYLGVAQYYKYALGYKEFDELFSKSADEIKDILSRLSNGQKKTVAYRAKQLIADGEIDSIKVINTLEEGLSIELIER